MTPKGFLAACANLILTPIISGLKMVSAGLFTGLPPSSAGGIAIGAQPQEQGKDTIILATNGINLMHIGPVDTGQPITGLGVAGVCMDDILDPQDVYIDPATILATDDGDMSDTTWNRTEPIGKQKAPRPAWHDTDASWRDVPTQLIAGTYSGPQLDFSHPRP